MAGDLRGLAMEKAEHLSGHLKELLSSGQEYVKARFGLDLGVDPELYPSWVVLSAAAAGLLVLLALSWAAVCGLLDGHKKRRVPVSQAMAATPGKTTEEPEETSKTVRVEEARRKTKKRAAEKRIQSNGQPVSLTQEVVKETEVVSKPPPPPHVKAEKVQEVSATAQVKKNKKKPKPEVKPAQHASTNDRKEPEEAGMWETKVSNREKKQLRRKDKGSDDLGSPGSVEAPKQHMEAQTATAHSKKNRGNHESQHPRKAEAAGDAVSSNWKDEATANGPGWSERSLKIPPQMEGGKWSSMPAAVHYRPQSKSQSWTQEAKAAWSDGQMKTDINSASFSMLGLDPKDQISNSCELQWAGHPADDEWSAFNRISAVDPCSDWNAPSEHWGNYEEPLMLGTPAPPLKEKPALNKILNDNDKEAEDPSDGAAKSKKRRKKKKKTEEEAEADAETVMVVTKPQELPVLSSKTMNSSFSSSSQKKMEPMAETVKSSQRKKIRKET
ncbi:metadherin a isoform X4 [Gouania willdenowi]|uniref:metadherin a isoform X4 n=1 Tax=Gouania willdenowi TaxID=441366 RepID=UPI0010549363|nr:protein LYRIC-like isoform X4 [Gouania willdenowi]